MTGRCMACGLLWGILSAALFIVTYSPAWGATIAARSAPAENCYEVEKVGRTRTGFVLALARGGGFAHVRSADIRFEPREGPMLFCRFMDTPRLRLYVPILRSEAAARAHPAQAGDPDRAAKLKWIHENVSGCCDHNDCGPATLIWTPEGWRAAGADNVIPFGGAGDIRWPFSDTYACIVDRRMRCAIKDGGL